MQVSKWGNSLAIRLPVAVVEALGLREGDEIEIEVADPPPLPRRARPTPRRGAGRAARTRMDIATQLSLLA